MYCLYSTHCFTAEEYFVCYSFCHISGKISSMYSLTPITESRAMLLSSVAMEKNKFQLE